MRKIEASGAAYERMRSNAEGSSARNPFVAETAMGGNVMRTTTAILEATPEPRYSAMSGASAMIGIATNPLTTGRTKRRRGSIQTQMAAIAKPRALPTT